MEHIKSQQKINVLYLDDVVDGENRFSPLHRVNRVLLQTALLLLQQTIKH